jgi:hypothetical protein
MVTRPILDTLCNAGFLEAANDVAIWIKNANRWHVDDGLAFLTSGFSQQCGWLEHRWRIWVLVIENWWERHAGS